MRKSFAAVAVLALIVAGCGGSKSGSASGGASGATIAPADVLAFVSVNTDESSDQWHKADALLKKFPIRDKLLAQINAGLSSEGVDFNSDVRPLLGPELDLAVVASNTGSPQLVGMTQPTDKGKFEAAIAKGSNPSVHIEVGDWVVFSDTQSALDAFKTEADKGNLADDSSFKDATSGLPSETNLTAYVNGPQALGALKLLKQSAPQLSALPSGQLQWLSLALSSQSDAAKLEGAVKTSQSAGQNFKPTLLSKVPSGALALASFNGSAQLTQQLTQNPALAQAAGQLQQLLGVGLSDITNLIQGEGVLYVAPGIPFPEVTLVLQEAHPETAMATLNKVAARLAIALHGKLTAVGAIKKLNLGPVAINYGISGGTIVISDSSGHIVGPVGTSITSDPVFSKAKDAAGLPDQSAGFVYVNIKAAIPLIEGFAQTGDATIPPDLSQNLAPLESLLAYATSSGGVAKFTVLLHVR